MGHLVDNNEKLLDANIFFFIQALLLHEDFSIQDQAVKDFEHWQNKKAIPALKHLEKFDKEWWTE